MCSLWWDFLCPLPTYCIHFQRHFIIFKTHFFTIRSFYFLFFCALDGGIAASQVSFVVDKRECIHNCNISWAIGIVFVIFKTFNSYPSGFVSSEGAESTCRYSAENVEENESERYNVFINFFFIAKVQKQASPPLTSLCVTFQNVPTLKYAEILPQQLCM